MSRVYEARLVPGRWSRRAVLRVVLAAPLVAASSACQGDPTASATVIPLDGFTSAVVQQDGTDKLSLSALHQFLEATHHDANNVSALFSGLGADGTLALTEAVGNHVGYAYRASEDESELAQKTLQQLKRGLGAATKAWDPDYSRQFGSDLVEAAQYPDLDSDYYQLGNYTESLAYLLYNATGASDEFILGAAEKIDELQHEANDNGTPSLWQWTGPSRFLPGMVDEADEDWGFDIPSIIMHDLGDHPRASYEFFTGDQGRIDYWAGEHPYEGDLSGIAAALDCASTSPLLTRAHKQETASIAARGLEALTGRDDFGVERGKHGVEGAQSLEHILETYMDSLVATYANSHGSSNNPTYTATTPADQKIPDSPWFSEKTLDSILGVVGQDGQALINLRTAINNAETNSLPPGSTKDHLTLENYHWAAVEGATTNAIGTGGIRLLDPEYKYAQAWADLAGKPTSELTELAQRCTLDTTNDGPGCDTTILIDHLEQANDSWRNDSNSSERARQHVIDTACSSYLRRMLWAADAAGLNGYQDPNTGLTLDSFSTATVQAPDGSYRLITPEEYEQLNEEDKRTANAELNSLATSADGLGYADSGFRNTLNWRFQRRFS
ncbi:hypothetical protein [Actinomyces sp. MRS3W]|uniref:hypothetical protein n=1 Tax=Actinomyces sp. MRS3W TaxID=2800796 RepID=UPI0028FDAEAA|nr:hypothetical protein [Actinomyces sp. MRS3W]MDU0348104.1 hypothetical protein [Actinomyces sp. MRS3W]